MGAAHVEMVRIRSGGVWHRGNGSFDFLLNWGADFVVRTMNFLRLMNVIALCWEKREEVGREMTTRRHAQQKITTLLSKPPMPHHCRRGRRVEYYQGNFKVSPPKDFLCRF
jgi:hypothetical protein